MSTPSTKSVPTTKRILTAKNCSISVPDGQKSRDYKPGEEIPEGLISDEERDKHLEAGHLEYIAVMVNAPLLTGEKIKAPQGSLWTVDPATLKGKDLKVLNAMIVERDPKQTPFETVEEAIAQLSLDFSKAK